MRKTTATPCVGSGINSYCNSCPCVRHGGTEISSPYSVELHTWRKWLVSFMFPV